MTNGNPNHASQSAPAAGWPKLTQTRPAGRFFFPAYSEFMPPPRLGRTPYGAPDPDLFSEADPYGWHITEIEEESELRPGLEHVGQEILGQMIKLGESQAAYLINGHGGQNLMNNPYWPPELAARAGHLPHERYVTLLPLALSRTQDDKGRVRWTFFGSSEQGPEQAFWQSFYLAPEVERSGAEALAFVSQLLAGAYGETARQPSELHALGFRILPTDDHPTLPAWCHPYLISAHAGFESVRFLLTFRPFSQLPEAVQARYFSGALALLPFPGSLVFWGMPTYQHLQRHLPLALQIPLVHLVARRNALGGFRVPQTGWLYEPHPDVDPATVQHELVRGTYARTHRWQRIPRHEDELALNPHLDKMSHVLFSTALDDMGLYNKPLARNAQLWTKDFDLLLDGPNATRIMIDQAEKAIVTGGLFGYRFQFPAMRVGQYEVYYHRPLVAYLTHRTNVVRVVPEALVGYLTAYQARPTRAAKATPELETINVSQPVELWPRLLRREPYLLAWQGFNPAHDHYVHQTALNIVTLLDTWRQLGEGLLPRSFARRLLRMAKQESLEAWLAALPENALSAQTGRTVRAALEKLLQPPGEAPALPVLTYPATATRAFEEAYWSDIAALAHGRYLNKDNADCVDDPVTQSKLQHHQRDLEQLGDYLIHRHQHAIAQAGLEGQALVGELPFRWETDFDFADFGGWKLSQAGRGHERDLLVVIPGKNRRQAVVLADHYDTAYMEDVYEKERGGSGARLAAEGADDNYSATATLLQAAPVFLKMARAGQLERDVWLLHLTGEEYPSDCMGARHFCEALVEKTLKLHVGAGPDVDLSGVEVVGLLVMDMIAHNRDNARDIFQISPGKGVGALRLAWHAHWANESWNAQTKTWNASGPRRGRGRGQRSADGHTLPALAAHLPLEGEVRTQDDPASSLFNTDGQVFSDVGVPAVLFMENYDINRTGYHDTHDTLENIDLDYGAAVAAIAIETIARAATGPG